jgi:RNA polymerase sigma-70 factor (ECF subfamily)
MGEPEFEAAVVAHHAEIYRYLRRVAWRGGEADDLSQETFLRAYRAWTTLAPDANVRAWLYTIATNVYRNHARGESRRRVAHAAVQAVPEGPGGEGPEEEAVFNEVKTLTERAVGALPFKQRVAFTLRKMHDVDYDTIGQSLGCSPESARAHVFQALRKIRASLNGHMSLPAEPAR